MAAGGSARDDRPGDRDRLAVALDALLENAVAHTDKDDRIELSACVQDGHVILAVTDSGCGIPEADLERIFARFSRATPYLSREVGGFGLGLPTAAAIAEAHHGSVRVNSTVGQGSTFELLIPAGPGGERELRSPTRCPAHPRPTHPDRRLFQHHVFRRADGQVKKGSFEVFDQAKARLDEYGPPQSGSSVL